MKEEIDPKQRMRRNEQVLNRNLEIWL